MSNRWKIILIAAGFNLLFEISLRGGVFFLANPIIFLFIFLVYFSWFILLEDLIGRFKLRDYHFTLLALIFPYSQQLLFFAPDSYGWQLPLVLGINWGQFIWLSLVWYVALQTIMAFYIGNRLFPRHSWKPLLSKRGWIVILLSYLFINLLFRLGPDTPFFQPTGALILAGIDTILIFFAFKIWPKKDVKPPPVSPNKVLGTLSIITTGLFIFFALTVRFDQTKAAANLVEYGASHINFIILWTTISAFIMLAYRLISKKPIPI